MCRLSFMKAFCYLNKKNPYLIFHNHPPTPVFLKFQFFRAVGKSWIYVDNWITQQTDIFPLNFPFILPFIFPPNSAARELRGKKTEQLESMKVVEGLAGEEQDIEWPAIFTCAIPFILPLDSFLSFTLTCLWCLMMARISQIGVKEQKNISHFFFFFFFNFCQIFSPRKIRKIGEIWKNLITHEMLEWIEFFAVKILTPINAGENVEKGFSNTQPLMREKLKRN